jgi:hypothetical protein
MTGSRSDSTPTGKKSGLAGTYAVWVAGLGAFVYGLSRWTAFPRDRSLRFYWHVAVVAMLLCAYSLRIGQATLLMTGLVLVALDALERERFNSAAVWLCLGLAVKPLAIVVAILAAAVERRIRASMLAAMAGLALLPLPLRKVALPGRSASFVPHQHARADILNILFSLVRVASPQVH